MFRFFYIFFFYILLSCALADDSTESSCYANLDVVLLFDGSGSVVPNRHHIQNFLSKAIEVFHVRDMFVHLSIIQFQIEATVEVCLTSSRCILNRAVDALDIPGGLTSINAGLTAAYNEIQENGRKDSKKVIVLITDGEDEHDEYFSMLSLIKRSNIEIFVVGVPDDKGEINTAVLREMATDPDHLYPVYDYPALSNVIRDIASGLCSSWRFTSGLCGKTSWLVGLALSSQATLLLLALYFSPEKNNMSKTTQYVTAGLSYLLFLFLLFSSFILSYFVCVLQALFSVLILLLSAIVFYYSFYPLFKSRSNFSGQSRAAEAVLASGGSTPASMAAFRLSDQKVVAASLVPSQSTVSGYKLTDNPLSRSLASRTV
ncbi:hypothetical protein RCL1_006026 [Eukaryota sp. TZLM3-RCL]